MTESLTGLFGDRAVPKMSYNNFVLVRMNVYSQIILMNRLDSKKTDSVCETSEMVGHSLILSSAARYVSTK